MHPLRFRQIHLDFHTSPHIPGIGEQFDEEHWTKTLTDAAVDSITLFATCHHGWRYYDGEIGHKHPHCDFDLLSKQYHATKKAGINAPIYLTAGVNDAMFEDHPEWREIDHTGHYSAWNRSPLEAGFKKLCFNTAYLDYLCEQITEVVRKFPDNDGIFLDIITQNECCCTVCMKSMKNKGYDPRVQEDRRAHADEVLLNYYKRTTAAAKIDNEDTPIFHNSGHITVGNRDILKYFSHLELESLPTGGWGYDHFPMSAKYAQTLDHDVLGMTGKFHTTWGEFGGFKHPNALLYECSAMIAYGAKCSVGDQLHPSGKLDKTTYDIIGKAYRDVASKEAWCEHVKPLSDVAILSGVAINKCHAREHSGDVGAGRILLEGDIQFDLIDGQDDFSSYKVIVLPDDLSLDDDMVGRLKTYLESGGKLLMSGSSGLRDGDPLFDLGADVSGESPYTPDYVLPASHLNFENLSTPFVMYARSQRLKCSTAQSLGKVYDPYFNRTYEHFSSHQHTPFKPEPSEYDLGSFSGNIVYFSHPIFSIYRGFGATIYKELALKGLHLLLGEDCSVKTNLPSTAKIVLNEQEVESRYIVHLLYAQTISRGGQMELSGGTTIASGASIEIIEDLIPLHNTKISLKLDKEVKGITLEPQGNTIPFEKSNGRVELMVPEFTCHQIIALKY